MTSGSESDEGYWTNNQGLRLGASRRRAIEQGSSLAGGASGGPLAPYIHADAAYISACNSLKKKVVFCSKFENPTLIRQLAFYRSL